MKGKHLISRCLVMCQQCQVGIFFLAGSRSCKGALQRLNLSIPPGQLQPQIGAFVDETQRSSRIPCRLPCNMALACSMSQQMVSACTTARPVDSATRQQVACVALCLPNALLTSINCACHLLLMYIFFHW